jgi:hypothetical protein
LGTAVTAQNLILEEIKRWQNLGNACYHSVQNLLSSRLLSRNVKIRIYRTTILSVILYGCETWSLTLMEEHRLIAFEKRMLRGIFWPKRDEVIGGWRKCVLLAKYNQNDQIQEDGVGRSSSMSGETRNAYRIFVGKVRRKAITRDGKRLVCG